MIAQTKYRAYSLNGIDSKCIEREFKRHREREKKKMVDKGAEQSMAKDIISRNSIEFLFTESRRSSECFVYCIVPYNIKYYSHITDLLLFRCVNDFLEQVNFIH